MRIRPYAAARPSASAATLPPPTTTRPSASTAPAAIATARSRASMMAAMFHGMTPPNAQFAAVSTSHHAEPATAPASSPRTSWRVRPCPGSASEVPPRSVTVLSEAPQDVKRRPASIQVRDDPDADPDHAPEEDLDGDIEEDVGVAHREEKAEGRAEDRPDDAPHVGIVDAPIAAVERHERGREDPEHERPPDQPVLPDE